MVFCELAFSFLRYHAKKICTIVTLMAAMNETCNNAARKLFFFSSMRTSEAIIDKNLASKNVDISVK